MLDTKSHTFGEIHFITTTDGRQLHHMEQA